MRSDNRGAMPGTRLQPYCPVALSLLMAAGIAAQDAPAFDAAFARYLAADAADRRATAAMAMELFLALPPPATLSRFGEGAELALAVDKPDLALELAAAGRAAAIATPRLIAAHLRALLRTEQFAAFVATVRSDLPAHAAAVSAVLAAEEAAVIPLAEAALRTGDRAGGRFVFQTLADLEPVQAYRVQNLALCQRQLGDTDAARATYERARSLAPDDLDVENDYGLFLRGIGDRAAATRAFRRSHALDLAAPPERRRRGPAITNLMHLEALAPGSPGADPLPDAVAALALRSDAVMLRRLVLDVVLDRLDPAAGMPSTARTSGEGEKGTPVVAPRFGR